MTRRPSLFRKGQRTDSLSAYNLPCVAITRIMTRASSGVRTLAWAQLGRLQARPETLANLTVLELEQRSGGAE